MITVRSFVDRIAGLALALTLVACNGSTLLVSTKPIPSGGTASPASGQSFDPSLSVTGRFTAFSSLAGDLVAGVTGNGHLQVYVYDAATTANRLVSRAAGGVAANGDSYEPSISADGRFVAYTSTATDIVAGTTTTISRIYVMDLQTLTTTIASTTAGGTLANAASHSPSISSGGTRVAFASAATNLAGSPPAGMDHVYVKTTAGGAIAAIDVTPTGAIGNGESTEPAISADGNWVVFTTDATNLFAGDNNAASDVVKRSLATGTSSVVSRCAGQTLPGSSFSPAISHDGGRILFVAGTQLFNVCPEAAVPFGLDRDGFFVVDTGNPIPRYVGERPASAGSYPPRLTTDGRYVVFDTPDALVAGDTNGVTDVYVARADTFAARKGRASVAGTATQLSTGADAPSPDGYGMFVAFESGADEALPAGATSPYFQVFRREIGRPGLTLLYGDIADQGSFDSIFLNGSFRIYNGTDLPSAVGAGAELVVTVEVLDPVSSLPTSTLIEARPWVTCTGNVCSGTQDIDGGLVNVDMDEVNAQQHVWNFNFSFTSGDLPAPIPTEASTVRIHACFHEAGFAGPDACVGSILAFVGGDGGIAYP